MQITVVLVVMLKSAILAIAEKFDMRHIALKQKIS